MQKPSKLRRDRSALLVITLFVFLFDGIATHYRYMKLSEIAQAS
jgi:hypothetical protein